MAKGYAERFARLQPNKNPSHSPHATLGRAPYKPLLLLSVLDLFEEGEVESNFIEPSLDLCEPFDRYWKKVLPLDRSNGLAQPFFHLRSEGFWHLIPKPGEEKALSSTRSIRYLSRLEEVVLGARLDEALYNLIRVQGFRDLLRSVLVKTHFAPDLRGSLIEQGVVNREAFVYSKELLEQRGEQMIGEAVADKAYRPAARDQGFRRAVVTAYAHRCALCGIRVRTLDGHTVVDAAHIVPWSVGSDDRPANGMALCRTCHWTFDEGLLRISSAYEIFASTQLNTSGNLSGYLTSLEGRGIVRPVEKAYWPDPTSLDWHHSHVFRRN